MAKVDNAKISHVGKLLYLTDHLISYPSHIIHIHALFR